MDDWKQYYFVGTSLPPIRLGEPLEMDFDEFEALVNTNVFGSDREKIAVIESYFDIHNMFALWIGNEVTPYGKFDSDQLEEAMVTGVGLPDYVVAFLEKYQDKKERIQRFPKLVADFYREEIGRATGFVKIFLQFERNIRLILTALRSKELGRDIARELQFEDPDDDLVAQILAQKDAKSYEPPEEWEGFKTLWQQHKEHPMELFQAQMQYRFTKISELLGVDLFSVDRLIGYMIQLISAEQWLALDRKKGNEILDKIVKETE